MSDSHTIQVAPLPPPPPTASREAITHLPKLLQVLQQPTLADQLALAASLSTVSVPATTGGGGGGQQQQQGGDGGLRAASSAGVGIVVEQQEVVVGQTNSKSKNNIIGFAVDDLRSLIKKKKKDNSKSNTINTTATTTTTLPTIRKVKSAMKKSSSYGTMELIGENIPISDKKNVWKSLPAPGNSGGRSRAAAGVAAKKHTNASSLKHVRTSPDLFTKTTNTSPSDDKTQQMKRNNVSFSKITVRDYNVTVGDAPCMMGPPVGLDWSYRENPAVDLQDYEDEAECTGRRRRHGRESSDLRMTSIQRSKLLKRSGINASEADIQSAMKEAHKTHKQRSQTIQRLPLMKLEDMMESATRKISKRLTSTTTKTTTTTSTQQLRHASSSPALFKASSSSSSLLSSSKRQSYQSSTTSSVMTSSKSFDWGSTTTGGVSPPLRYHNQGKKSKNKKNYKITTPTTTTTTTSNASEALFLHKLSKEKTKRFDPNPPHHHHHHHHHHRNNKRVTVSYNNSRDAIALAKQMTAASKRQMKY